MSEQIKKRIAALAGAIRDLEVKIEATELAPKEFGTPISPLRRTLLWDIMSCPTPILIEFAKVMHHIQFRELKTLEGNLPPENGGLNNVG